MQTISNSTQVPVSAIRRAAICAALFGIATTAAHADTPVSPPFDAVQLVSDSSVAASPVLNPQSFTVTAAGDYTVTLTDLATPAALNSVQVAIVSSTHAITTLSAAGSKTVTLAPGNYTAQALATATAAGGEFSLQVAPAAGGSALLTFDQPVAPSSGGSSTGTSTFTYQFTPSQSGSFQLTLTDDRFPSQALQQLEAIVLGSDNSEPILLASAGSISGALTAGVTYSLYIVAVADSADNAGLFSAQLTGPGSFSYATTQAVGKLPAPTAFTVSSAGSVSTQLTDLNFPSGLSSLTAMMAQGATVTPVSSGSNVVTLSQGSAQLFVWSVPASGAGSYAAYASAGGTALLDIAAPSLTSGNYGYDYSTSLAAAGTYQLSINDFQIPQSFASVTAVVTQSGAQIGQALTLAGKTSISEAITAAGGMVNVLVFPSLMNSTAESLFGVALTQSGSPVYQATQGVGAQFSSRSLLITAAGNYIVQATDLAFPANLATFAVIVTQGQSLVGQIQTAGQLPLNSAPVGTYVLNILATVGTTKAGADAGYGLYGLHVAAAAAAPTINLMAAATSVPSGTATTLTWSSSNAVSCSASGGTAGSNWTGTLATSGSMSTGALTASTTFSLACTNVDGAQATSTVQVTVTANSSSSGSSGGGGGGGALTLEALLTLFLFTACVTWRRRLAQT